jgi:NADH-quinone oxidoreductase subunit L
MSIVQLCLVTVLAPLVGSIVVGLFGKWLSRSHAHLITIGGVALALVTSGLIFYDLYQTEFSPQNFLVYEWAKIGGFSLGIGFLIDSLTAIMMIVVTSVSLMVHIYTIGYMHEDPGYKRFFSYISLFTFSMLMLVMSNNFLQLFFGWEAVGLVSYLLIGFWYTRPSAILANIKAFLVNRVGDFGFLLGISAIAVSTSSLDYAQVFAVAASLEESQLTITNSIQVPLLTFICIALFVGAMGKSAQVPLHVWLPDSMEGPTPISALIHAATMVTAGIFMVARMSPLFELSETALLFIMFVGAITAFFMGLVAMVQDDIKKVVAYSTLSQLGYMTVALGVSAYSLAIFHLYTHAFFKALLFLAAGSVIIAMHHEQDIRKMGGLWKRMPITYATFLIGTLALIGFPAFSGFFSKESIIEAVHLSELPGAHYVYWMVLSGVFITAFYSLRLFFLVFHGKPRMRDETYSHVHETPKVVTVPLIILAICSVFAGYVIEPMIYGDFFAASIHVGEQHGVMQKMAEHFHGVQAMITHGFMAHAFYLLLGGVVLAWLCYLLVPSIPKLFAPVFAIPTFILTRKYGFDWLYIKGFARLGVGIGKAASALGDRILIDGLMVNGTANMVRGVSMQLRKIQSGYLYQYAFAMIIGLLGLLTYFYFQV